jgi:hypothetical protein
MINLFNKFNNNDNNKKDSAKKKLDTTTSTSITTNQTLQKIKDKNHPQHQSIIYNTNNK